MVYHLVAADHLIDDLLIDVYHLIAVYHLIDDLLIDDPSKA